LKFPTILSSFFSSFLSAAWFHDIRKAQSLAKLTLLVVIDLPKVKSLFATQRMVGTGQKPAYSYDASNSDNYPCVPLIKGMRIPPHPKHI